MSVKDYYIILGIPRDETLEGIRAAYRARAKKIHPDRVGPEGTGAFQDLTEAYETLSDPDRRRRYDRIIRRPPGPELSRPATPAHEWSFVEPVSIVHDFRRHTPPVEALHETLLRDFFDIHVPKARREQALNIELVLTPEEARTGGRLPLEVPVFHRCRDCGGSGHGWPGAACSSCDGRGALQGRETVAVRIPPMVEHGSVVEASLRDLGIHDFFLRLHLLVGRHPAT